MASIEGVRLSSLQPQEHEDHRRKAQQSDLPKVIRITLKGVLQISLRVVQKLKSRAKPDDPVEMEPAIKAFTMDSIAKCVFSIDIDSTANPDNEFKKMGQGFMSTWRFMLASVLPAVSYWFNIGIFNPTSGDYFARVRR